MLLTNLISNNLREYQTTENKESGYSTQQLDSTLPSIRDGNVNLFFVVFTVVLLIILITMVFVIVWRKRKDIRKRMSCLARSIRSNESDIEALGTLGCSENAEKTKENIQASDNTHEENQSLLNADDSATEYAEGKEKIVLASNGENVDNQIMLDANNLMKENKDKQEDFVTKLMVPMYTDMEVSPERFGENLEEDKSPASNDKIIENQSKLDVEELMEEQEKSNEAKSISLQAKDPVHIGKDVLAGNIDIKLKNKATKADSISAQTEALVCISKDVSFEKFDENKQQETSRERLIERMANLLLHKDVLVLISSLTMGTKEFAHAITIKACEHTQGANIRPVYQFNDLRDIVRETLTIVLFIHDTFKGKRWYQKDIYYVNRTLDITLNAMETKASNIHTLICLPSKVYKDFEVSLKKKSLTFAVYDLSTIQEHKTA